MTTRRIETRPSAAAERRAAEVVFGSVVIALRFAVLPPGRRSVKPSWKNLARLPPLLYSLKRMSDACAKTKLFSLIGVIVARPTSR